LAPSFFFEDRELNFDEAAWLASEQAGTEVACVLIASGDASAARIYELVSWVRSYYWERSSQAPSCKGLTHPVRLFARDGTVFKKRSAEAPDGAIAAGVFARSVAIRWPSILAVRIEFPSVKTLEQNSKGEYQCESESDHR